MNRVWPTGRAVSTRCISSSVGFALGLGFTIGLSSFSLALLLLDTLGDTTAAAPALTLTRTTTAFSANIRSVDSNVRCASIVPAYAIARPPPPSARSRRSARVAYVCPLSECMLAVICKPGIQSTDEQLPGSASCTARRALRCREEEPSEEREILTTSPGQSTPVIRGSA
ncbi:hypothetical protein EVJ58_g4175 [Rhodofomes roseus]|uniref:Uncharacterized protein n=1 Tax=Rhodofomes roseus TaxID=34475 RepID=A0A4Y9YKG7_9APHY|nr:hypothetical protein EVJ58_g4175 [Rhodofomes roseus]